jgi:uncharacterized membrane protein YczE
MVVVMSLVVLVLWIPLREKPGIGTIANALLIGSSADLVMAVLPAQHQLVVRLLFTAGGVVLCGFATALYIGAQFGRGPRDGLMTGLVRRTGASIRLVRTGLEVAVVIVGLCLGGKLGLGTIAYALTIGPLAQRWLPAWIVDVSPTPAAVAEPVVPEPRTAEPRPAEPLLAEPADC